MNSTTLPPFFSAWQLSAFRLFVMAAVVLFIYLIGRRISLLFKAKRDPRWNEPGRRWKILVQEGVLQPRHWRYPVSGGLHLLIFWGFILLAIRSAALLAMGLFPAMSFTTFSGTATTIYSSIAGFFEVIVLLSCVAAMARRAFFRPKRYQESRQIDAIVVLSLIGVLMLSDMVFEGCSQLAGNSVGGWHPGSTLVGTFLNDFNSSALRYWQTGSYWVHMVCFFVFLNFLPLSKHFHILTALPNVCFRKMDLGEAKLPRFESPDIESIDEIGAGSMTDFTWKQLLDLYACTECGRCTDHCPANAAGRDLSPKKLIMTLRDQAYHFVADAENNGLVDDAAIWACTTCGACEAQCPVFVEHVDKIIDLRRYRVLATANIPPELENMYRHLEFFGDPWGNGPGQRENWAAGLDIPIISEEHPRETLLWVGCAGAFDIQYQKILRTLVRVLKAGEIDFGILGEQERCCGDAARRTGNEYLFQQLAKENIERLTRAGVKTIITACPHGFNTLSNEYPRFGGRFIVRHHSQVIQDLLRRGFLYVKLKTSRRIVYHDPCYLGRYNSICAEPRQVLSAINESPSLEPEKSGANGFCCGAGGGYMWLVETGNRVSALRAEQLLSRETDVVVTACPFCHTMLTEAIATLPSGSPSPKVCDIAELVEEVLR